MSNSPKAFGIKPKTSVETETPAAEETLADLGARRQLDGDILGAREAYTLALETDPNNPTTLNNLGFTYAQEENWEEAVGFYRRALQRDAAHGTSWMNLGCALAIMGENDEALQSLLAAVKFSPDNPTAWENLGRLLLLGGQAEQAEIALRRAAGLAVHWVELAIPLSNAVAAQGRLEDAIKIIKSALSEEEQQGDLWRQLGILCFLYRDLGSAANALQNATILLPADTEARHHLAMVRFSLGQTEHGILELERILTLEPDHLLARTDLAVLALSQGDLHTAKSHIELAIEVQPSEPRIRYYHAMILAQQGDTEAANQIYAELAQSEGKYAELARKQTPFAQTGTTSDNSPA